MATTYVPIEGPAAWKGSQIDYRRNGLRVLSPAEVVEIDAALAHLKAAGDVDFPEITSATFPLPVFGRYLAGLRRELRFGRGFVLLRGLPRERYSADDIARIHYGLGVHIGVPTPQSHLGELLGNVIDVSDILDRPRGYLAGGKQRMHSDSCDIVALLCLRAAKSGGASRIASAVAVHDAMVRSRPDLAAALYAGMIYRRMELDGQHGTGMIVSPAPVAVFARAGSELSSYYLASYALRAAQAGDATLTALQSEAIEEMQRLAASEEFFLDMSIGEGDIQFLNNRIIVHGRTDYEDFPEVARRRHMLRLWLAVPEWPAMPANQVFHTAQDHLLWARRRHALDELPSIFLNRMSERKARAADAAQRTAPAD
jgi:hypothetical protein